MQRAHLSDPEVQFCLDRGFAGKQAQLLGKCAKARTCIVGVQVGDQPASAGNRNTSFSLRRLHGLLEPCAGTDPHARLHEGALQRVPATRLNTHISAAMGRFVSSHPDWLTEVRLPAYAPDLNPAEGAWVNMKNGLGNLAARNVDQLAAVVRNRLKRIQYRPQLIDGFLAQTGLSLEPQPP